MFSTHFSRHFWGYAAGTFLLFAMLFATSARPQDGLNVITWGWLGSACLLLWRFNVARDDAYKPIKWWNEVYKASPQATTPQEKQIVHHIALAHLAHLNGQNRRWAINNAVALLGTIVVYFTTHNWVLLIWCLTFGHGAWMYWSLYKEHAHYGHA